MLLGMEPSAGSAIQHCAPVRCFGPECGQEHADADVPRETGLSALLLRVRSGYCAGTAVKGETGFMVRGPKQRPARRSDQLANHVERADMTRIGVLADTHLRSRKPSIPSAVLRGLQDVDLILHAGDICCASVLELLGDIAPVVAVHGNVDPPDLQSALPADRVVNCDNVCIGLTHGHLGTRRTTEERALERFVDRPELRVIVFGHSHIPVITSRGTTMLFNPGSPTQRRTQPRASYGLIEIDGDEIKPSLIYV